MKAAKIFGFWFWTALVSVLINIAFGIADANISAICGWACAGLWLTASEGYRQIIDYIRNEVGELRDWFRSQHFQN